MDAAGGHAPVTPGLQDERNRLRTRVAVALATFASLASFAVVPRRAQSSVIDIGSRGCCTSLLTAIDNRGEAVGVSEFAGSYAEHAIVWRDGRLVDLGVLPGATR